MLTDVNVGIMQGSQGRNQLLETAGSSPLFETYQSLVYDLALYIYGFLL